MEQPRDSTLPNYLRVFAEKNVEHVVRVCPEETYDAGAIESERGIRCHAFPYPDGDNPSDDIIEQWLELCRGNGETNRTRANKNAPSSTIAIHCVAGLGRAPVLVAIALIEEGMDPIDAITAIREARRHAINKPQLTYLTKTYKRRKKSGGCACM